MQQVALKWMQPASLQPTENRAKRAAQMRRFVKRVLNSPQRLRWHNKYMPVSYFTKTKKKQKNNWKRWAEVEILTGNGKFRVFE